MYDCFCCFCLTIGSNLFALWPLQMKHCLLSICCHTLDVSVSSEKIFPSQVLGAWKSESIQFFIRKSKYILLYVADTFIVFYLILLIILQVYLFLWFGATFLNPSIHFEIMFSSSTSGTLWLRTHAVSGRLFLSASITFIQAIQMLPSIDSLIYNALNINANNSINRDISTQIPLEL